MNKRGLSMVVTTLIIILLVLVAVGIVWVVIRNLLSGGTEGIFLGKFMIDLKIKNAYVDENNVIVNIKRNPGQGNLAGVKFIFYNATDSESADETTALEELGEKGFTFILNELNASGIEKVSIAPIYKLDSGEESLGDITDTYIIGVGSVDGETGDNGNGNGEPCIPNCTGKECGDDGCGGSCGPCDGNCVEGVCEGCTPNCTGKECGSDGCGENENCGTCDPGECVEGFCIIETSVNNGTVDSVWPPLLGAAMYFDSEDLPKSGVDYYGYYINFTGAELDCLLIAGYITPDYPEIYNKTHIRFSYPTDITTGDKYEIWESGTCGA